MGLSGGRGGRSIPKMRKIFVSLLFLSALGGSLCAHDEKSAGVVVERLEKSGAMWNGAALPGYPHGEAEITVLRITIPPKARLPWHKHPVINCGYLLEGELHVFTEDGAQLRMKKGDAIVELVDQWHYGENPGEVPTVILVFYAGAKGEPLTVLRDPVKTD